MIESGVVTKDVEQFVCVNLKLDAKEAFDLEDALETLIVTKVTNMLPENGQNSIVKLQEVLEACLKNYESDFNDNEEFVGNTNEES